MRRLLFLGAFFCILGGTVCPAWADDSAPALDDTSGDLTHHMAHFGAGAGVGVVPDFFLTRFREGTWERAWYTRLIVDCTMATLITDIYESSTDKDPTVRMQHDCDGALGALFVVSSSVRWSF